MDSASVPASDVDSFTEADRDRMREMVTRLDTVERRQRITLRRVKAVPELTAAAIVKAVAKRGLILIGVGIALGSALGGAGIELVRAAIPLLVKGPH